MDSSQSNVTSGGNGGSGGNGMLIPQTNDPLSPAAADDFMQKLNHVINSIQKTLVLIHQLYLTVSTYNPAFQMPLLQLMCNIRVPMEVSSDKYFAFECSSLVHLHPNSLHKHVLEELEQNCPDEAEAFRESCSYCCYKWMRQGVM